MASIIVKLIILVSNSNYDYYSGYHVEGINETLPRNQLYSLMFTHLPK